MTNPKVWAVTLVVFSWLFSFTDAAGQTNADRIMDEALKPSPLEQNLRRLADEIGGRVPGTPAMEQAVQWGIEAFQAAGADRVHKEEFRLPVTWAEGATEVRVEGGGANSKVTAVPAFNFKLRAVSMAWAPAVRAKHIQIVDVGFGTPDEFGKAGDLTGKLLLVNSDVLKTWPDLFNEYLRAPPVIEQAVKGKATAIAFIATREHDILYRHTNSLSGEIDKIPMILVAREDGERVARLLAAGSVMWADLDVPNKIGGPTTSWNVVAEIQGSEKPEEFVILGAHLDSWELGTGALDNGCNAALVIDALRTIKATGLRPRRSMRFILFTGEEQGLLGSRAYAVQHRAELDKAAGVAVIDSGIGRVTGFTLGGRKDIVDAVAAIAGPLAKYDATKLTTDDVEWGTDNFDFLLEGVPTLVANQEEGNYLVNYHATSDTFDKVDIPQLKKHVAEMTVMAFGMADAAQRVGPRLSRPEIQKILVETHTEEQLKPMGMWEEWENGMRGRAR